ncbi:Tryptophan synthase subunit beta [Candidatus Magnetobacterium bavaricum]|uniref:Tryptophan synthase subunit beta n=1 Tax=Candidatus Magnetobacterium bavaricum TaxID=29290 RepID=A0A0F3GS37_9BACT|nr:Tryptophan synthase subunit beta [Candidatus Magnetobacterium bavaricum]
MVALIAETFAAKDNARKRKDIIDQLAATDAGMIRIIEDVIDALVAKSIITINDLPEAARTKLSARATLRGELS